MKDIDDARNIIKEITIDFKVIIEEARNQIELGRQSAAFELGEFLENLKKTGVKIPQKVLDELFKIVKKQAEEKVGKKAI
jgi:phage-related holin